MVRLYKFVCILFFSSLYFSIQVQGQTCPTACGCGGGVPSYTIDLRSSPDNADTIHTGRSGLCCGASGTRCIVFTVLVHSQSSEIAFDTWPGAAGQYQVNCGPLTNAGDPLCLGGTTTFCITYCKPGGDNDYYAISASRGFSTSNDIGVRVGCTGEMRATGFVEGSIQWRAVPANATYDTYLATPNADDTMEVTPAAGAPAFIDYEVSGTRTGCASGTYRDTVRVYVYSALTVSVTPAAPVICAGAPNVNLAASVSGGAPPYAYSWSPGGQTTSAISAGVGTYTVAITDTASSCPAITQTVAVTAQALPAAPVVGSNSTVCSGNTISLTASSTGTTYSWTGPNSFTSTAQNPSITGATTAMSGTYSVTATTNGCTGPVGTGVVTVNSTPAAPTLGSNTPVCTGRTLSLTSNTITGASYSWSGPNSYTSSLEDPAIASVTTAAAGTYTASVQVGGCPGPSAVTSVIVNVTPSSPSTSSNTPICTGQTLTLVAGAIGGATYSWAGPNNFTSTAQVPTIPAASSAASGNYSVTATVSGCASAPGIASVTVNVTPSAPVASNSPSPACSGQNLTLSSSTVVGASYSWSGPNGFTSASQNPIIAGITTAYSGTYSVTPTVSGCTGPAGTTSVTVNSIPAAPTAGSNSPVCSGTTLNLTANTVAGATYSWTGPNSFTSSLEDPSIAAITTAGSGNYSVTTTVSGCTGPAGTTSVTVNATPTAPTAGSNSPVCAGTTLSLTANTVAGAAYFWTGPNSFTSSLEDPTIAAITTAGSGNYSVTTTVSGCTGPASTTSVTVNPIPSAPTAGSNAPVCSGTNLNLTANTVAGGTYSWTGPNSFTSTLEDPTIASVTTAGSGNYSVTVTVAGCTGSAGTTSVTVNATPAAPTAGSNSPVCTGTTLSLTANTVAGAAYSWTGPNSFTSSLEDPTIAAITTAGSGNYSVTTTVSGCTGPAGTTSVTVNSIPAAPTAGSNSPVCSGTTLNLTANTVAGATYSWTGPNSFTSSLEDPSIAAITTAGSGNYSVTTTVLGCTGSAGTTSVTVNATPAAPTAGSNGPICVGTTLSLTANTIAGATYAWTGPSSFTSVSQNPTIGSAATTHSGTYSVTATVSGCTGAAGTVSVTISPVPATPTAGNTPVCTGHTLSLTANTIASSTYNWSGPNNFTSSLEDPTIALVTTAASGNYSVSVTVGGCTGAAGTTSVTIQVSPASPTPSSNAPICSSQTLNLFATATGVSYNWNGPNGFTSTAQNPSIAAATSAATGTYSVTATAANGCVSTPPNTLSVTVTQTPTAPVASNDSPLCSGQTASLTASTFAGATYSWSGPNSFTSTLQNPTIVNLSTAHEGTYSVTATVAGCSGPAGTTTVVVDNTPPTPAAGSNAPCTGGTMSLTANNISMATYYWAGPSGFTSTLQNPTIVGATTANAGSYSVTATVDGCTGAPGTTNVTVSINPAPPDPVVSTNSPICAGEDLNLFSSTIAGASYTWTGPNSFSSSLEDPVITAASTAASGTYSIVATYTTSCASNVITTASATVTPLPAAPTAGSNSPLCTGVTLNLTASAITGATYNWSGPNSFTSTSQNPSIGNVGTVDAGTYSVTATVSGCTGPAGTVSVAINPPQTPTVTNTSPTCTGQTLSLTANTVAGGIYTWTGPNGFTSSLEDPSITGATAAASGTYSVSINLGGCVGPTGVTTASVNVTPATPAPNSNTPVCVGFTLSLTSNNIAGTTYSWTGPNSFTSTLEDPTIGSVSTAASGTYSVHVTSVANGCVSNTATTAVIINLIPGTPTATATSPICSGQTISLTASTIGSSTYSWTGPASFTSASQNPTIASASTARSGTYSVTATENGCTSAVGTATVLVNQTPSAPTTGSNTPVCEGQTLSLTASTSGSPTYSWTGPNSFTSTSQDPTIAAITSAGAGVYSVTATENSCTGPAAVTSVTVTPLPGAPSAGSNTPVCSGQTLSLTSGTISGAVYSWSGPNSFTSTAQDPTIASITTAGNGTYSVSATVNGCAGPAGTTSVTIYQTPDAPNAASNSTVCSGLTLSLTASTVGSSTYSWTGPNSFTSTNQDPAIASVTTAASGTYSVTATENGCTGPAGTTVVAINQTPSAPTAGNNSAICEGQTLSLTAGAITGATYSWSGPGGFTSTLQNPTLAGVTVAEAGTYSVNASAGGCQGPDGTTIVTINPTPSAPVAGSNSSICSGQTLSLTATAAGSPTYLWSGPLSFTTASQNPTIASATTARSGTYSVTATENGCTSPAGTTVVVVNPTPSITAGSNGPVCEGNTISLTATTVSGATYSWSGPNGFTDGSQNPTIGSVTSVNSGTYTVNATSDAGCVSANAVHTLTVTPSITVDAGTDQTVCGNNANINLAGTVSGGTLTGIWTPTTTGTYLPGSSSLTGIYIASSADTLAGAITFTLTSTNNGGCAPQQDVMTVLISDAPTANTGPDQTVCANNATITLSGSVNSAASGGSWTSSGTGTFSPDNITLGASYIPSAADTTTNFVILTLTTTGVGLCSPVADQMTVTITNAPLVNAGATISVCSNNASATLSGSSSTGSGIWTTAGTGTFTPSAAVLTATFVPSAADIALGSIDLILTSTSNLTCNSEDDTVTVVFTSPPVVSAGSDVTVCANNNFAAISGTSTTGTGLWATAGTGTFALSTALTTTYTTGAADNTAGNIELSLTSTNNGGCLAVTDQMTVTITPAPTADAGASQTVCANNAVATLSGSFTIATGGIWSSSGTGTFTPDDVTMGATYTPSAADTAAGSVIITLTTTGNDQCNAVTSSMTITITDAPRANAGANMIACKNNANVTLNGSSTTGAGTWTTSGTGTFTPTASTLNATYVSSPADTIAGSVTLILTTDGNGLCLAEDDSITITYIDKPIVNAGSDQTVCSNNPSVSLSGASNTGSGIWTTLGTGTFTPSASILSATYVPSTADTVAGTVMLILTSTNNGTCNAIKDTAIIAFSPAPTANAGTDQTVCANNAAVSLNGGFTVSTGAGWTTLGSGTFSPDTFSMGVTYTPSAADTAAGSVSILLTTTGNGICNPVSDTLIITISDAPVVNAGTDQLVCLNNLVASLNGTSTTGSGTWSTLGTGTFSNTSLLATTYTASAADSTTGSVKLILESATNGTCIAVTDTILLSFVQIPVVNAGVDQTVCANADTVSLAATSTTGAGIWTTSGTGTFSPTATAISTSYIAGPSDISTGTVSITFTSTGGCTAVVDNMMITITPAPIVNAGVNQTVCAGTVIAALNGSVSAGAITGIWTTSGTGTFSPGNTALTATYNISSADSAAGAVTLTLVSTNNGNCYAVSDPMSLVIMQPAVADAGVDTSICGISITLYGTITGGSGTGAWTTVAPDDGAFSPDSTSLNALFGPLPGDTHLVLVLSSTNNGPCPVSRDTMEFSIQPAPAANAGSDLFVCKNNLTTNLNGMVFYTTTGHWTTAGTGTFVSSADSLNATYIPSISDTVGGSIPLILSTTGKPQCPANEDTVMIIFTSPPNVNAAGTILVCEGDTIALLNGSVSAGASTGIWSTLGSGYFTPNDSTLNGNYILSPADTAAGGTTLVLTSTNYGNCLAVTDTVDVTITPVPIVTVGSDVTVCANNAIVTLNGSVTVGSSTGIWTSSGTGIFTPSDTVMNPTYTPSPADTAAGTITIKLTSSNGCRPIPDSLVVTLTDAPVANAGADITICEGTPVTLNGSVNSAANGAQWTSSGNGTFVPNDSTLNATYVTGSNDTSMVTVTLTTTGNGLCSAVKDSMAITIGRNPIAGFSVPGICTGSSVTFTDNSSVLSVNDSLVAWNWTINQGSDTLQNPTYTYGSAGKDSVMLIVTSSLGCSDTALQVMNISPTPAASFTVLTNCSLDSVYFNSTSSVSIGNIISWSWNFGDTNTSALQNPVHYYDSTGVYIVSLTVTSDSGCTSTFIDTVTPAKGVVAGLSFTADCDFNVQFADTSITATGDSVVTWSWNFGDGSASGTSPNPSHAYSDTGNYIVVLHVTTLGGCTDSIIDTLTLVPAPVADFTPAGGTYNAGETVTFTDLSLNAFSWMWNFGDGNTDTIQNPTHTYDLNGALNVMLIVTNSTGCPDTAEYSFIFNTNIVAVPSAFTPNGDGVNDVLLIRGGPLKEMDWRIFNEWGNEVFRSTAQSDGWDGKYKGKIQPEARFVFILKGTTYGNETIELDGEVTILR